MPSINGVEINNLNLEGLQNDYLLDAAITGNLNASNLEVFCKINNLLDNTLNLNNIPANMNKTPEASKASPLDHLFQNLNTSGSSNSSILNSSGECTPTLDNPLYSGVTRSGSPGVQPAPNSYAELLQGILHGQPQQQPMPHQHQHQQQPIETPIKQGRAIRACSQSPASKESHSNPVTPAQQDSNLSRLLGNSPTSDSDTSGIGSDISESALIDFMNSLSINQGTSSVQQRSTTPSSQHDYTSQYYQQPYQQAYQQASMASYQPTQSYSYQSAAHQPCYQSNAGATNHLSYATTNQHTGSQQNNYGSHMQATYPNTNHTQQAYPTSQTPEMQYGIPTNLDLLAQQNLASGLINVSAQLAQQPSMLGALMQPSLSQADLLRALGVTNDLGLLSRQHDLASQAWDLALEKRLTALNQATSYQATSDPYSIEKAAKLYRNAASVCEATSTWSGQLPPRVYKNPVYSCKVFLGGVPWDLTEPGLQSAFKAFGSLKVEWPGKDGKHPRYPSNTFRGAGTQQQVGKAGYVYVLFESEKSVRALLQACTHDFSNGGEYYFKISSRRMRSKEVQVIPWVLNDSNYVRQTSQRLDPTKTVFVGALHGMMTAEALAHIMNDLFANVVYAGIDTDKHKYPIGSGRVTFSSHRSYMKAVNAAFVEIKTPKFTKKVQIDPYLEDSLCSLCGLQQGPFFCRDLSCFRYYCRGCWQNAHTFDTPRHHKPLMRNSRSGSGVAPAMLASQLL